MFPHLERVVQHGNDLVVVICDGHLQVQAVELRQVSTKFTIESTEPDYGVSNAHRLHGRHEWVCLHEANLWTVSTLCVMNLLDPQHR